MRRTSVRSRRRGFSRLDVVGTILAAVLGLALVPLILNARLGGCRCGGGPFKDAAQVREVHRALVMWSQQNNDRYPIPSMLDQDDSTVVVDGDATLKDDSAAVMSILAFSSLLTPEVLISPREASIEIEEMEDYIFLEPAAAADPKRARWDPALRAVPERRPDGTIRHGNVSYTHLALAGAGRAIEWGNTLNATYAVLGNRGAEVADALWDYERKIERVRLVDGLTGTESITMLIHGAKNSWEGNIAYNDNHVAFEMSMAPDAVSHAATLDGESIDVGDCLFLDEADPASGAPIRDRADGNIFLGLFDRGPTQAELDGRVSEYLKAAAWYDGKEE